MAVNLFCINNATAEAGTDPATTTYNRNQEKTIEVYDYEDVENLSEEPIASEDTIYYTENN